MNDHRGLGEVGTVLAVGLDELAAAQWRSGQRLAADRG
jgi:hypothetical protein